MLFLEAPSGGPTLLGMPMKQVSLITLTFQNSALILIMHYSRIMRPDGDHRYFTSTAVLLNEIMKLAVSLSFAIYDASQSLTPYTPATVLFEHIYRSVFSGDGWKLAIPATLYTVQNTLLYVALGNLDAVHFQVLYQLKILATAFFSVALLGRSLGVKRWTSVVVLTIGVAVVSLPSSGKDPNFAMHDSSDYFFPRSAHELGHIASTVGDVARELPKRTIQDVVRALDKRSASYEGIQNDEDLEPHMNYSVGLSAVLVSAAVSGLTGVYFEKVLKDSSTPVSVWTRNVQLAFYSIIPAVLGVVLKDGTEIARHGFFDGYNWVVWTLIVLQAIGGILSSLCIHYADNIAKNFATSLSIVVGFLFSVWVFEVDVTSTFLLGTALVLFSTYLYTGPERKRGRPPPINIVSYEKTMILGTPAFLDEGKLSVDLMGSGGLGLSTSRPASPMLHHGRVVSAREKRLNE